MHKVAYLLVVHGSHHPSYNAAVKELTVLVQERAIGRSQTLGLGRTLVDVAFLEAHPLPLHQQIVAFADRAVQEGMRRIQVLPLFLLPGVHVYEDIPAEVAIARNLIDPKIALELLPYIGTQQKALSGLLLSRMAAVNDSSAASIAILFSHGSRRHGGNQPVEAIAHYLAELSGLEVVTAYSFVAPFLSDILATLKSRQTVKMGYQQMAILPYVLFPGGLTEAIADSVTQLCGTFEDIQIKVAQPIAVSRDFAELIVSMAEN
ncbi:sirohydrochlorin chelatase [Planktothricoides raciborskii]|uniref:Sirohydrochlorin chelatase n=2 Tax=Planktothricoides raciborskii TaxID=132608 RepID=A0AAU8JD41_9CYAN|nr:sirohydrochlorin chelatase [Planktothricoides raciborskii]MBD2545913.1 sirohydrochlorin chelatase [Planktothricoides raciborskii FACHB-1370]MBD2584030.1 sirohydrochlorin chelatase [Planktothricoides raciborskii FACHB-1261]